MNIFYVVISIIVTVLIWGSSSTINFDEWVTYTAIFTFIHACFSVSTLKRVCRQWTSLPMLFLFSLFLFNWGQVWLLGFFKGYELYYDWNKISIYPQYIYIKTCIVVVLFITFFVLGVVSRVKHIPMVLKDNDSLNYPRMRMLGMMILFITLPFNLYENALYIAASVTFGYKEIFELKIPDFVSVFSWISVLGAVCYMIGSRSKEGKVLAIFSLLYGAEMISGNRAQSVVAILILFSFYNLRHPIKLGVKKMVLYGAIAIVGLTVLQTIKTFRNAEGKDFNGFIYSLQSTALQHNVILQNLEEFGGAIAFPSIMLIYSERTGDYLYGWTYLSGLAGILPNVGGGIGKITNSGSVVFVVRDHIYGQYQSISCSNVSEAVLNFGLFGIPFFSFVVGILIGLVYIGTERKQYSFKILYYVMPSYALLFWVRNSFQSTVRYIVWGAILIWIFSRLVKVVKSNRGQRKLILK